MSRRQLRLATVVLCAAATTLLAACQAEQKTDKVAADEHTHHHHVAPRGGMLVEVGDHFANLEVVVDTETGRLTAHVMDGCAEHAIRIAQPEIMLTVILPPGPDEVAAEAHVVFLAAVVNPLTGETVGDTSEFTAVVPELVGARFFGGVLGEVAIRGTTVAGLDFYYPEDLDRGPHARGDHDDHDGHDH
jgi:hypothetical protein